ncbi:response regulator transcription factor [Flavobacterium sp.]|uniref:response regulator transcription factor n=1 Tax=Flavobacterium sp. TaxID=239 RepID=UPI0035B079CD
MNVLIADDHQLTIDAYKTILPFSLQLGDNINFIEANSCEEAYLKINQCLDNNLRIDLAILDYSMPIYSEKNILNGADVCIYLQKQMPNCINMILTSIMENIILFEIILNVKPHGIVTKSDIDGNKFLEIIEILLSGKKYRSGFVSMQIEEIWENKAFVNELNRKILQYLAKGYKLKEIAQELDVSEITIKKHISKIRESLNLNEDDNILKEAKSRGYL